MVVSRHSSFSASYIHCKLWLISRDTFLELILTCQPDGRIVLHERHETLEQFKELVQTKNVTWQAESEVPLLDQVLDLAFFLKSYQCKRAMSDLVEIIARRVAGLSALSTPLSGDSSSQPRFPPLILFAVGARVERPDVCEAALNFPKGGWAHYDKWTHPPGLGSDSLKRNTLHLLGIPYKLLAVLPYDYKLALALTPVKKVVRAGSPKDDTPHGSHFIARLRRIQSMRTECDGKKGKRPVIFVELSRSRGRRFKRGE